MSAKNTAIVEGTVNPYTPFAFLSPDDAFVVSFIQYVVVTSLGIMFWDILNYVPSDYEVIFQTKFTWKIIVFLVARVSPVGFLLSMSLAVTSDRVSCRALHNSWCALFLIAKTSTSLLFYFRVSALYHGNRFVSIFFAITLVTLTGAACLLFKGMTSFHIGPTSYCGITIIPQYVLWVTVAEVFNDILTSMAIIHKLGGNTWQERKRTWIRAFRPSRGRMMQVFMQDSLIYYLIAISLNVFKIACFFALSSKTDSSIRILAGVPNTVVINSIALRVFRNMKLGLPGLVPIDKCAGAVSDIFFQPRLVSGGEWACTDLESATKASSTKREEIGQSETLSEVKIQDH
ncbi:hypothetical protein CPB83DRAFT_845862 [Crepidotus variabilis]|uniref:Uncharacterized protein n=1 Tax=Crepidotus variabilis TaxID=179855 RepID=A0A9P6JV41_9AGAR|nr:hypothetical protein CPB83DRAFT_845862 [Crepidotus variabilis]